MGSMHSKTPTDNLPSTPPVLELNLTPEQRKVRIAQILNGFGVPPEEHKEYLLVLQGHLDAALDGYLSRFKRP
jgi:hypothetical protein